jgi:RNA 2',3'-cyclic 3'-phosphodiesterase
MRYFIALEIPDQAKSELESVQQGLKNLIPEAKLTDNDKLHITIAFIGEQPPEVTKTLTEVIEQAARDLSPFTLVPGYIDAFPNLHHPRIIWVGVKEDVDKLFLLRERIKDGLQSLQLEVDERRYTPHIAIAKIKGKYHLDESSEDALESLMNNKPFQPIQVSSIKLFQSVPDHGFHSHNTLAQIPLI